MIAALVLTAAISLEIDLSGLIAAHRVNKWRRDAMAHPNRVTCGIRVVGYRWYGEKGRKIKYLGKWYTIGDEGQLELIAGRAVPEGATAELDQFGFSDVREGK